MADFPFDSKRLGQHYDPSRNSNKNPFQQFNASERNSNSLDNVFKSQPFSLTQEPDIEYEEVEHYLVISSFDRDTSSFPNPNHYQVTFNSSYKNVSQIELIQSIVPDTNNVTSEPFLLLKIDELEDVMDSVDRHVSDSFAILCLPSTTGKFLVIDKRIHENTIKTYRQPKASVDKFTITLSDYQGNPFDFGTDSSVPQKTLQNTHVFKITTLEKKRSALNHRNVY